ncbi:MAG: hypothetical protein HGA81_00555 [Chlorobium limicola]|nr:hypothetical protein [Chlorobium limicola]
MYQTGLNDKKQYCTVLMQLQVQLQNGGTEKEKRRGFSTSITPVFSTARGNCKENAAGRQVVDK